MTQLSWRRLLTSITLMLSFSCAALGGDNPSASRAVLHASGKVQVNGASSRDTTALFSGDSIQTTEDSVANIDVSGSSVLLEPSASVKFKGTAVELAGGSVSVATSEGMAVNAYGLTIMPVAGTQSCNGFRRARIYSQEEEELKERHQQPGALIRFPGKRWQ